MAKSAVILFSHGSVLCGSEQTVYRHAERMAASGCFSAVEVGFLNYSHPTFDEAVSRIAEAGVNEIRVVPYFLVAGKFVTSDLPKAIAAAASKFPDIRFSICPVMGVEPELVDAVLRLADQSVPVEKLTELRVPEAACRKSEACPLYSTELCPTTVMGKV
jgi:sirohydrochlorin cobaltochelatase